MKKYTLQINGKGKRIVVAETTKQAIKLALNFEKQVNKIEIIETEIYGNTKTIL